MMRAKRGKTRKSAKPAARPSAKPLGKQPAGSLEARVKELEARVRQYQEADKLRDQFLDVISHELKTPLIPIMGYIDLWAEGGLDEDMKRKSLEVVRRNAKRLKDLIDDILLVSKIESGKLAFEFAPVDLEAIARRVAEDLKTFAADKGILISVEAQPNLPQPEADKQWLGEVVQNLAHNALKFTPNNGKVVVRLSARAGKAVVEVVDSGIGIEKKHLPHLFQKFYQVDSSATRQFGGTGLGLDICKSIVEKHGGRVWVQSEVGLGSTFGFEVPVKHAEGKGGQ